MFLLNFWSFSDLTPALPLGPQKRKQSLSFHRLGLHNHRNTGLHTCKHIVLIISSCSCLSLVFPPRFPVLILLSSPFRHVFCCPLSLACKDLHQHKSHLQATGKLFSVPSLICTARWAVALFICLSLFSLWAPEAHAFLKYCSFFHVTLAREEYQAWLHRYWLTVAWRVTKAEKVVYNVATGQLINAIRPFA